ncbi:MAG: galactose oxidase-like domain-containing protein [Actinomycetota bacterium]
MRRVVIAAALAMLTATVAGAPTATGAAGAKAEAVGEWGKPFAELPEFGKRPPNTIEESLEVPPAVSMAMLPDGRVVYWGGLEGIENSAVPVAADGGRALIDSRVRVLDLNGGNPRWSRTTPGTGPAHDMFCADQRLLADGRLLVVGGTIWRADPVDLTPVAGEDGPAGGTLELFGSDAVRLFDPDSDSWRKGRDFMRHHRWYPTLITLGSGDLFIASGVARLIYNYSGQNVNATETYEARSGEVKQNGESAATSLPLFPRLHLLPDGNVFYGGVGQMWGPFGQAVDEALWAIHKSYDPKKKTWTPSGIGSYGARSGAFSVLLPLKPPYKTAEILVGGGTLGSSPGSYVANDLTEVITVKDGSSTSEAGPSLTTPRWYSSGVLLPDGNVVALSGADRDEVILPGSESPVTRAEMFDGKKWVPLANAQRVRTYHNTAMLLADGSILVGGHAPINTGYGATGDNSAQPVTGTNNLKDPSFEIFKPPYLFRGPRPSITHLQKGIAWGERFEIGTSGERIKKVVLTHLPAVTHITDADQRSVELEFSQRGGRLEAAAPSSPDVAPPGYYYLFVLSDNGRGLTPSRARIVRVGDRPAGGEALAPMGR